MKHHLILIQTYRYSKISIGEKKHHDKKYLILGKVVEEDDEYHVWKVAKVCEVVMVVGWLKISPFSKENERHNYGMPFVKQVMGVFAQKKRVENDK